MLLNGVQPVEAWFILDFIVYKIDFVSTFLQCLELYSPKNPLFSWISVIYIYISSQLGYLK